MYSLSDYYQIISKTVIVFGADYKIANPKMCKRFNFIVGEVKLAIYKSRKNKIENCQNQEVV